jgi:ABC-2 type transport system ATP-binding protein
VSAAPSLTPPGPISSGRARHCNCGGDGLVVSLDRSSYHAPGPEESLVVSRCNCGGDAVSSKASGDAVDARGVSCVFGDKTVLDGVSLATRRGEIHALLGPNGAGKTTLLRVLTGLITPAKGSVRVAGVGSTGSPRALRRAIGLVPSGDRTFYLRISGVENLLFFARLQGMDKPAAASRAAEVLELVGLSDAARKRVGVYSQGMLKRLSIARALLTDPDVLLVDEATHGLDPEGSRRVRDLVIEAARGGAAVVWATQHLDEIRGLAHRITLLDTGRVRFVGSVPELMAHAAPRRHIVRLRNCRPPGEELHGAAQRALAERGRITLAADSDQEHYLLSLADGVVLGEALTALATSEIQVLTCRQERSEIEEAFFSLTAEDSN